MSRASTATSCSCRAASPVTRCGCRSASPSAPTPRRGSLEVLTPSPDRIEPLADHPGAPWQVIPYAKQLEIKHEQVDDALRRIGRLDGFELEPIVPAVEQWRYRNKLEYSFGRDESGRLICGFHAPGRWEEIVEVTDCLLASEAGNRAREEVVAWCRAQGLEPYDRRTNEGFLRNLVVREGRRTGEIQVRLVTARASSTEMRLAAAVTTRDGLLWTQARQRGRDDRRRRDRAARGRRPARGAARRALDQHLRRGLLPDQHRDGGAALRAGDRVRGAQGLTSGSTTSTAGSARSAC